MDEERYSIDGKIHDSQRLKELQALPLWRKIQITQTRILEWYNFYEGKVYVSFSGGKDSTVLLDLARRVFSDIEAVFIDTGLEFPEIRDFVKTFNNVTWLHPVKYNRKNREYERISFKEVIMNYGYPIGSKNISQYVNEIRHTNSEKLKELRLNGVGSKTGIGVLSKKWRILINAPFECSEKCCVVMKKKPAHLYDRESGKHPIIGTMANESKQRKQNWIKNGCNAFSKNNPSSQPMSFWTEQDVLEYINTYKIPYASVYGDIVKDENEKYKTTGESRTGCVFCGFGCHLEKSPNRFERLKETHPKMWDYCIRPVEENGLGMGAVLDYINVPYGKDDKN